jgi:hypothetical protein
MTRLIRLSVILVIILSIALPILGVDLVRNTSKVSAAGGMEQLLVGGYYNTLPTSGTEYNSLVGGYPWGSTRTGFEQVISTPGTIKDLQVRLEGSPGAGKSYAFTLMIGASAQTLTCTISGTDTTATDVTHTVAVAAGNLVSIRCVASGTPTARVAAWNCVFLGDNPNESIFLGLGYNDTSATEYTCVSSSSQNYESTESEVWQVVPTSGTVSNLYVSLVSDPGTNPDAFRYTLRKNGVSQALTCTITADDKTGNDTDVGHAVSVVAGDLIDIMIENLNTPSTGSICAIGTTFTASIDKESVILGSSKDTPTLGSTEYNRSTTTATANAWNATESQVYQLAQHGYTLSKLYVKLNDTSTGDYTVGLRGSISGNTGITCTVSAGNTTASDTAHTYTTSDYEYIDYSCLASGTARHVHWGLVCFSGVAPTVTGIDPETGDRGESSYEVIITGTDLTGATSVDFSGTGVSTDSFSVDNATQITAQITIDWDAALTARNVSVTTAGGTGSKNSCFTITAPVPTVTDADPSSGNRGESSKEVILTGTGFVDASVVSYSGTGITVDDFDVDSGTQITSTITITWDATLSVRNISVTTPGGTGTGNTLFTVGAPAPTVTLCAPNSGNRGESSLEVVMSGTGFIGATVVAFSGTGITVDSFVVDTYAQITSQITIDWDATLSLRNVTITTDGGPGTGNNLFTVGAPVPTVTRVSPKIVEKGTDYDLIIAGTGFIDSSVLDLGDGITVGSFSVVDETRINASVSVADDAENGVRVVSLTTPGGTGTMDTGFKIGITGLGGPLMLLVGLIILAIALSFFAYKVRFIVVSIASGVMWLALAAIAAIDPSVIGMEEMSENVCYMVAIVFLMMAFTPLLFQMRTDIRHESLVRGHPDREGYPGAGTESWTEWGPMKKKRKSTTEDRQSAYKYRLTEIHKKYEKK